MKVEDVPIDVKFYDHRGKRIRLLRKGSEERKRAESLKALREQHVTFHEINERTGLSLSTMRRSLTRLEITEAVEEGQYDAEIARLAPPRRERRKATGDRRRASFA